MQRFCIDYTLCSLFFSLIINFDDMLQLFIIHYNHVRYNIFWPQNKSIWFPPFLFNETSPFINIKINYWILINWPRSEPMWSSIPNRAYKKESGTETFLLWIKGGRNLINAILKMASREMITWSHECSPLLGVFCV